MDKEPEKSASTLPPWFPSSPSVTVRTVWEEWCGLCLSCRASVLAERSDPLIGKYSRSKHEKGDAEHPGMRLGTAITDLFGCREIQFKHREEIVQIATRAKAND